MTYFVWVVASAETIRTGQTWSRSLILSIGGQAASVSAGQSWESKQLREYNPVLQPFSFAADDIALPVPAL